jgi:hypothetical protein
MRNFVRFRLPLLTAMAIFIGLSSSMKAALLAPGDVVSGLSLEGPHRDGGTLGATILDSFSVVDSFTGTYVCTVANGDLNNSLGGLTFIYRFLNDETSLNSIGRIAINGFGTLPMEVSYAHVPGLVAPAMASRDPNGNVIGFNFIPLDSNPATGFLAPGESTPFLLVRTAATAYKIGSASLIDGGGTTVPVYVPVPEPFTIALLAFSMGTIIIFRRRILPTPGQ